MHQFQKVVNEPAVHHRLDDAKVKEISENSFNKNKGLLYQGFRTNVAPVLNIYDVICRLTQL